MAASGSAFIHSVYTVYDKFTVISTAPVIDVAYASIFYSDGTGVSSGPGFYVASPGGTPSPITTGSSTTIYSGDGTIPDGRVVTLGGTVTFTGGTEFAITDAPIKLGDGTDADQALFEFDKGPLLGSLWFKKDIFMTGLYGMVFDFPGVGITVSKSEQLAVIGSIVSDNAGLAQNIVGYFPTANVADSRAVVQIFLPDNAGGQWGFLYTTGGGATAVNMIVASIDPGDPTIISSVSFGTIEVPEVKLRSGVQVTVDRLNGSTDAGTPTFTEGPGAGVGPTITIDGNEIAGQIKVTAGTAPDLNEPIVIVEFTRALPSTKYAVSITAATPEAANIPVAGLALDATHWAISSAATPLVDGTTYIWSYIIIG